MLVESSGTKGMVLTFKLVNGDEIVAKVVQEYDTHFVINRPVVVVNSERGIMIVQALFTGDFDLDIPLNKNSIMMHVRTTEKATDYYIDNTATVKPVRNSIIV